MIPGLRAAVVVLARVAPPASRVLVPQALVEAAAAAQERGFRVVAEERADAAFLPAASRAGPVVPTLEAVAPHLAPRAPAVVADLMWKTAPTPELLAAFPGTRPMEGYEMQAEHAGFDVAERVDLGRDAFDGVPLPETQRAALAADARGAALWRILVLRRA